MSFTDTPQYRANHQEAKCSKCDAEILWVTMEPSGKKAPLDIVPNDRGNIVVMGQAARTLTRSERIRYLDSGAKLYVNHFATCPEAAHFSARRKS